MKFVLATFNRDKARELEALLALPGVEIVPLADWPDATAPEENGVTLAENALIKARAAMAMTGLPAIADDTGLEVDALGGAPYTPDDVERSSLRAVWDVSGRGVPDTRLLNSRRNGVLHQLDLRVDKRWSFRGSSLDLYLDVQNVYAFAPDLQPTLAVQRDAATGAPLVDPGDPTRYRTRILEPDPATPFPTIGLRVTF